MRARSLILPTAAAIAVAVIALALAPSRGSRAQTPTNTVGSGKAPRLAIANYAFAPPSLTVRVGTTIMVTNADSTAHTATARSGGFDTGTINPGHAARITVDKPGTYTYYCQFHAFMTGTIKVVR